MRDADADAGHGQLPEWTYDDWLSYVVHFESVLRKDDVDWWGFAEDVEGVTGLQYLLEEKRTGGAQIIRITTQMKEKSLAQYEFTVTKARAQDAALHKALRCFIDGAMTVSVTRMLLEGAEGKSSKSQMCETLHLARRLHRLIGAVREDDDTVRRTKLCGEELEASRQTQ